MGIQTKKLAVSHLNEDEKDLIVEYLKFAKICGLTRFRRDELQGSCNITGPNCNFIKASYS